eukprot:TRINITY_DN16941_c0_g1_i2.p2 TRINITY_DN16941_c0_g1~~TRINITY_DN16941_c0_g1_i2.p2  ORF type:complete len:135 (-),score=26.75 TRINITY_DN16941_c0_g1_i2:37-441(-)
MRKYAGKLNDESSKATTKRNTTNVKQRDNTKEGKKAIKLNKKAGLPMASFTARAATQLGYKEAGVDSRITPSTTKQAKLNKNTAMKALRNCYQLKKPDIAKRQTEINGHKLSKKLQSNKTVSYTHLTLPTIYPV